MVLIVVAMFFIGRAVKTRIGKFLYHYLEKYLLSKIPLYSVLSETVSTIADRDQKAFSKVVLVDVYGSGVYMTGFVTDETNPEWYSIFVPTAPNPTNGFVFSTRRDAVIETDLKPEDAVRTVVGMGAGSTEMLSYLSDKKKTSSFYLIALTKRFTLLLSSYIEVAYPWSSKSWATSFPCVNPHSTHISPLDNKAFWPSSPMCR